MSISSTLFGVAIAIFAGYFYLFQKHLGTLSPEQRENFVKRSRPGRWVNFLIVLPLVALLLFEDFYIRVAAALALLGFVIVGTSIQHKSLQKLKFSDEFISKLRRISYLAGMAVVLFVGSLLLNTEMPN